MLLILLLIGQSVSSPASGQSLTVYDVKDYQQLNGKRIGFISLSEGYRLVDHPDSLAVPKEHLGENVKEVAGSIALTRGFRDRCLKKTKIAESDKVHIYDFAQNRIATLNVADLKLLAFLSPYHYNQPVRQHDYLIGFEVDGSFLEGFEKHFPNTFAVIDQEDPFVKGEMYPMVWERVDASLFPPHDNKGPDGLPLPAYTIGATYRFKQGDFTYFLQDNMWKNEVSSRRFMVIRSTDNSVVCNHFYYHGESGSFAPLHLLNDDKVNETFQWTGRLFENKPLVFVGLKFQSFGCPAIDFIDTKEPGIIIRCDNRH